ncbi:MAG: toxin TcdB middle/N-terminal domain-containing protein [Byssovorax sp.]
MNQVRDEDKGPALVFADGMQTIFLADMSGDGLTDLVRIRNGNVCYWPNLGYGRFGAKVVMGHAPHFDNPDQFDPRRIRLADVDGSGTTDILYIHRDGVRIYENQAGNRLGDPVKLPRFSDMSDLSSITVLDLLGTGTACLLWSTSLPGKLPSPLRYIDLLGSKKPHLLTSVKNNLGLETKVEYAPSTKFSLEDAAAGRAWITKLPFPVQVLTRVETFDSITRHRFVSTYKYHHGYYDGVERGSAASGWSSSGTRSRSRRRADPGLFPARIERGDRDSWYAGVHQDLVSYRGLARPGEDLPAFCGRILRRGQRRRALAGHDVAGRPLHDRGARGVPGALRGQVLRQEIYAQDGSAAETRILCGLGEELPAVDAPTGRLGARSLIRDGFPRARTASSSPIRARRSSTTTSVTRAIPRHPRAHARGRSPRRDHPPAPPPWPSPTRDASGLPEEQLAGAIT